MTINGVDCKATVLDNEITCRIPKDLTIPSQGAPVKVRVCNRLNSDLINLRWLYISFMMHCYFSLFSQVFVNGEEYDIGVVVTTKNNYILGMVLGIIAAVGVGAFLAYIAMAHERNRKKGKCPGPKNRARGPLLYEK